MQASDKYLYEQGCAAYNGNREARRKWFSTLAPLATEAAVPYGVLPSLVLAKAALESGYGTDLYESEFYEPQCGIKMARKAKNHNNLIGMNAFPENLRYLDCFPRPAWDGYKAIFNDFGPHFNGDSIELATELWKHYKSIEDCFEDWCANVRYQAEAHNKPWGTTIEQQLLAIESYTPEGAEAETPGMHYEWQDYVLYLYHDYDLGAYDRKAYGMKEKMTIENLDANIKRAYEYAHMHCTYGPTDRFFPPMEDGLADCVGLVLRALYTMGYLDHAANINMIRELCEKAGMKKSTDANDVWKHHSVVCMQDKHLVGTVHVSHVYYSLGGKSLENIDKYDLGSDERIQAQQPFRNVTVNEWTDKRNFLCCYYLPEDKREDTPHFASETELVGTVIKSTGMYAGPGTAWRKLKTVKAETRIISRGVVTNDTGKQWRSVRIGNSEGYIYAGAIAMDVLVSWRGKVNGTDGNLSLRVGAGGGCYKTADIPESSLVRVDGEATANDGSEWLHVRWNGMRGFVSALFVKEEG